MLQTYPRINYEGLQKRIDAVMDKLIVVAQKNSNSLEEFKKTKTYRKLFKKIRKAQYIKKNYFNFQFKENKREFKYLINHFYVEYDYDYWKNVFVFNTTNIDLVRYELERLDIELNGSNWTSEYDCTGKSFYQPCKYYRLSDRIIVTQSGALDV